MKVEWEDYLNNTYTFQKSYYNGEQISYECGDGWFQLLKDMFEEIKEQMDKHNIEVLYISQIKEKFGGLRVYADFPNKEIEDIAEKYENKSLTVCEYCGLPSHLRIFRGWVYNMCDPCYNKIKEENKYV